MISIQEQDFSVQVEYEKLKQAEPRTTGAICTFTGLVREFGDREDLDGIFLEHYPGMTEKSLEKIIQQAKERWSLNSVSVIHRIGALRISDQIVFVGISASHRAEAFQACEFIMDYLKTQAPFWKKELSTKGNEWVEAKQSDVDRSTKWAE